MQTKKILTYVLIIAVTAVLASSITHIVIGQKIMSGDIPPERKIMILEGITGQDFDDSFKQMKHTLSMQTGDETQDTINAEILKKLPALKSAIDAGDFEEAKKLKEEIMNIKNGLD